MRVLVAYETAHGSTAEIAEAIAEAFRERGADCDLARCRKVRELSGYDAVILGSPVWAGKWLKPAQKFLRANEERLAAMPLACFCTSLAAASESEQERGEIVNKCIPAILAQAPAVKPLDFASFAGVLNYPRYNLVIRAVMRSLMKREGRPTEGVHDFRDWEAVRDWAGRMYDEFTRQLGQA